MQGLHCSEDLNPGQDAAGLQIVQQRQEEVFRRQDAWDTLQTHKHTSRSKPQPPSSLDCDVELCYLFVRIQVFKPLHLYKLFEERWYFRGGFPWWR